MTININFRGFTFDFTGSLEEYREIEKSSIEQIGKLLDLNQVKQLLMRQLQVEADLSYSEKQRELKFFNS